MDRKELGTLACKTLGLFLIIHGINLLANIIHSYLIAPEILPGVPEALAFPVTYICSGVLLWLFAGRLSGILVSRSGEGEEGAAISAGDLGRLAFAVLGLYFAGDALPGLASTLVNMCLFTGALYGAASVFVSSLVAPVAQLLIGLALFFGSRGLAGFLNN